MPKLSFHIATALVAALILAAGAARAQAPPRGGRIAQAPAGTPLGTAFTYQGRLDQAGSPITAACDFRFDLYNAATGGARVAAATASNVAVTDGLFTVPSLDFGGNAFAGEARWLELAVGCPSPSSSFTPITPRQALAAAPYALYARVAGSANALQGRPVSATGPGQDQALKWNGAAWVPAADKDTTYGPGAGLGLAGTTFSIIPGGIATTMLADGAVTEPKLANGAVGLAKLGPNAVNGGKVVDGSIGGADVNGAEVQRRITGTCGVGQAIRTIDDRGAVQCEAVGGGGGPWTLSGTSLFPSSTTYNVGVGMNSPTAKLYVTAATGNAVDAGTSGATGTGVTGRHLPATGAGTGVLGTTASTDINAAGVAGRIEATGPSAGGAAVSAWHRGTGASGYGVLSLHSGSGVAISGSTTGAGVGVQGRSTGGTAMLADGNVKQALSGGGWVKALVRWDGAALRCFRGDSGASPAQANTCAGFSISGSGGDHTLTIPFAVNSRFILVTPEFAGDTAIMATYAFTANASQVRVRTWRPASGTPGSFTLIESAFTLVVF